LKRRPADAANAPLPPAAAAERDTVVFTQTGDAVEWTPQHGTLLEFAEGKGLAAGRG